MPVSTAVPTEKRAFHHIYESLLERQRERLVALAARCVGYDDAEDVAQTALLKAYQGLPHYQGSWEGPGIRRWVHKILKNVIADHQRTLITRNETALNDTHEFLTPATVSEQWEYVRQTILELLPKAALTHAQEVCMRRRLEGETQTRIAQDLGVSQPAVSQHFAAALVKLQQQAPETIVWLFINSPMFRALCKATIYHKPQTVGAALAKEQLRRLR